jgi:HJR/Mrr/RecB family endonuclease
MVKTDIGQHIASRSWFHAFCTWITLLITAKSADSGARILVMAAQKPKETHVRGAYPRRWLFHPC